MDTVSALVCIGTGVFIGMWVVPHVKPMFKKFWENLKKRF